MKRREGSAQVLVTVLLSLLLSGHAISQKSDAAEAPPELQAEKPPEHPVTREQLHTYFNVMHIPSINRQLIHEKLESQRKQLPQWYPPSVWNEITNAIENIDMAEVALPVYQKYVSQDDAKFLIQFMATPQGQKLSQTILTKDTQSQVAGAAPELARDQTIRELERNEGAEVERVLSGLSPKELRNLESQSAHWQQMQPALKKMRTETGQAIIAKQTELARAISAAHQSDLAEAKRSYDASHP